MLNRSLDAFKVCSEGEARIYTDGKVSDQEVYLKKCHFVDKTLYDPDHCPLANFIPGFNFTHIAGGHYQQVSSWLQLLSCRWDPQNSGHSKQRWRSSRNKPGKRRPIYSFTLFLSACSKCSSIQNGRHYKNQKEQFGTHLQTYWHNSQVLQVRAC